MLYQKIVRPLLFSLTPEKAHILSLKLLHAACYTKAGRCLMKSIYCCKTPSLERELFGIKFKNPVGIAAGLDKNGDFYNDLAVLGPSFIEIGSLTEKPQEGNPRPRVFRLPEDNAIINRMGINNNGVKYAIKRIEQNPPKDIVLAGSITKGSTTPNQDAPKDFERNYSMIYDFVDMVVLNISCPNVEDLSSLQDTSFLSEITDRLNTVRRYNDEHKPLLVKLSPDIPEVQLDALVNVMLLAGVDGIVATNTTRGRDRLSASPDKIEEIGKGGLSGAPLFERSVAFVRHIHQLTGGLIPIIGVGGIMTPEQAKEMLDAGASLIEVYTGFIYNGPSYFRKIVKYLEKNTNK